MRFLYALLFFSYGTIICAMEVTDVDKARQSVQNVLITVGKAQEKHVTRALISLEKALAGYPNGSTQELLTLKAFAQATKALSQDNCDAALSNCVDVINGARHTPLLKEVRAHTWKMLPILSDEKQHTLAQFYLLKHLLNSSIESNVEQGLSRFDSLFARNVEEKDYRRMAILFRYSDIMADIKNLADTHDHLHAQFIMGAYHLFLAEHGKEMDGSPVEPRAQLKKAGVYAQKMVERKHPEGPKLLELIEAALKAFGSDESIVSPEQKKVVPARKIAPLKLLAALACFQKILQDDQKQLYAYAKKLLEEEQDELYAVGMQCMKRCAQLGNPFAAERAGDYVSLDDPLEAVSYYRTAIDAIRSAPRGTIWRDAGRLKLDLLERKIRFCSAYYQACDFGEQALLEKALYGSYNKDDIDQMAALIHSFEKIYVTQQQTIDTHFLERVVTTGAFVYMDHFRDNVSVQNVLINLLALRAHVGRGFVLDEKTCLAHYKKVVHFIVDPKSAALVSLHHSVPDKIVLKKISIDSLHIQHRIIYLEAMIGIVEQLTQREIKDKGQANFVCGVFALVCQAMEESNDFHLKHLLHARFVQLFSSIQQAVRAVESAEHLAFVGNWYVEKSMYGQAKEALYRADQIYTEQLAASSGDAQDTQITLIKQKLASVKAARAHLAHIDGDMQQACHFYKTAAKLNPADIFTKWKRADFLVNSGSPESRAQGLKLMKKLANSGHRKATEFMAIVYCGHKPHLGSLDIENGIACLQKLIENDPKEYPENRAQLAILYIEKSKSKEGNAKKLLLAKADSLISAYKRKNLAVHMLYIDLLVLMERTQEIWRELGEYCPDNCTEYELFQLAHAYYKYAIDGKRMQKTASKMFERAEALLQRIKGSFDEAYPLLLSMLLTQRKFDQCHREAELQVKPHMRALTEIYRARACMHQHGLKKLEGVIEHAERAFDAFEAQFLRSDTERERVLSDLLASVDSQCVHLTHPMKQASLDQLEKMVELFGRLIMQGDCSDAQRARAHAYNGYYNAKLTLLWLGTHTTYENVLRILKTAAEAAQKVSDEEVKVKLVSLIIGQIQFWREQENAGTLAERAQKVTALLAACAVTGKGSTAAILQKMIYDIVNSSQAWLQGCDMSDCSCEETKIITLQQTLIVRLKDRLNGT